MQNRDYNKRYEKASSRDVSFVNSQQKKTDPSVNTYSTNTQQVQKILSNSTIGNNFGFQLIILILIFTGGYFTGYYMNETENQYSSNEMSTFKNIPSNDYKKQNNSNLNLEETDEKEDDQKTTKQKTKKSSSIPSNLQFPPKSNQVNYILQLGEFNKEEANKLAVSLMRENQEFQGRVFRTNTGKLYAGYYYSSREAKEVLNKIKKFRNGTFSEASIKTIQF
jgi:hypothetical protein